MENEELFIQILDNDEKIIETFRPNKKRFVGLTILRNTLACILTLIIPALFILLLLLSENDGVSPIAILWVPIAIAVLVVFGYIFSVVTRVVVYKKTCYCCTNKRIIIRRGFIGADYQTLDYDLIGGMDVTVDFLDKIIKPNTGTIAFASAASPMMEKQGSSYYFAHIENPYETYKKIKEYSSTYRDGKLNS